MGVKQDYLMRMINDVVRGLALVLTGQREVRYELPKEQERTEEEKLYARILEMADRGEINEAENMLLENIDYTDKEDVMAAALFYQYLGEKDDKFLEDNCYSMEEVIFGFRQLFENSGYGDLLYLMKEI